MRAETMLADLFGRNLFRSRAARVIAHYVARAARVVMFQCGFDGLRLDVGQRAHRERGAVQARPGLTSENLLTVLH